MTIFAMFALLSCGETNSKNGAQMSPDGSAVEQKIETSDDNEFLFGSSSEVPHVEVEKVADDDVDWNETVQSEQKTESNVKPVSSGKVEHLYVSTYGANGQVWGHVTMRGGKGGGTIHDADENTLSIRVTRHGNELFGVDQNGRQYVFKL